MRKNASHRRKFVWKHISRDKTWEIRWQVAYRHVPICENLHTETYLQVKSCIVRRVYKLKSRDVVFCFECTCGKLCDKQGVICLKLHIDITSQVKKVCTHPSLSARTCRWTRLVVNTLRGNMAVEIKHRKLCGTSRRRHVCVKTW